jgi:Putative prokaryotic signal transducing protein
MKANTEDFRRQYGSLNDEALLEINRDDLVPMAQQCYDVELSTRGLAASPAEEEAGAAAPANPLENLIELASFVNPSEATVARSLLRLAEIPCALSTDFPLQGSVLNVAYDVKLYVPSEFADQAQEVLESEISDEELAAQAEAAGDDEEDEEDEDDEDDEEEEEAEEDAEEDAEEEEEEEEEAEEEELESKE